MTHSLERGEELSPLPNGVNVLRAIKVVNLESATVAPLLRYQLEDAFVLSSSDKKEIPPALSVYVDGLTTPQQAIELLTNPSRYGAVARLAVNEIRAIPIPEKIQQYLRHLDVL